MGTCRIGLGPVFEVIEVPLDKRWVFDTGEYFGPQLAVLTLLQCSM